MSAGKRRFEHGGFAVVRSAARSSTAWDSHALANVGGDEWLGRARSGRALFNDAAVREALYLASPALTARLGQWDWQVNADDGRKLLLSFERYYNRMCHRATPFGTFAAVTALTLDSSGNARQFRAATLEQVILKRSVSLDSELVHHFFDQARAGTPETCLYALNASAYRHGEKVRYVDWRSGVYGARAYNVAEIDCDASITHLIDGGVRGPLSIAAWAAQLANAQKDDALAALQIVEQCVAARLLLPYIAVDFFSADPLEALRRALAPFADAVDLASGLGNLAAAIGAMTPTVPANVEEYITIKALVNKSVGSVKSATGVHVDAFRHLSERSVNDNEFSAVTEKLTALFLRFGRRSRVLDDFAREFQSHYEGEFVRLSEVLDDDIISAEAQQFRQPPLSGPLALDRILLDKLVRRATPTTPIQLAWEDIADIPEKDAAKATTDFFALLEQCDGISDRFELVDVMSSNCMGWMTRFAYADTQLEADIRRVAQDIEALDGNVAHAEVSFIPSARIGNVMRRPQIWSHCIDLIDLSTSGASIPVSDLWIHLGETGLELWSKSLGKRVIPHVTSAHNADHVENTRMYRFLRAFERHGKWIPMLQWGAVFGSLAHQPRIEYETLVLCAANWTIELDDIKLHASTFIDSNVEKLRAYFLMRKIPSRIKLVESDNSLILDTHSDLDILQVLRTLKKNGRVFLREMIQDKGALHHELILPIVARGGAAPLESVSDNAGHARFGLSIFERTDFKRHVPMTQFIFAKVYLTSARADEFLCKFHANFCIPTRANGSVRDWFFIRYADPGNHLRLRMACAEGALGDVMGKLTSWLDQQVNEHAIYRYQFDQYKREYLRYGGYDGLAISEKLFGLDSEYALAQIRSTGPKRKRRARWMIALVAVDAMLSDAGLCYAQSYKVINLAAERFAREFSYTAVNRQALAARFRTLAPELEAAIDAPICNDTALMQLRAERRACFAACTFDLKPPAVFQEKGEFLRSHLHMACNRLLNSSRKHEAYIYGYLARIYRSRAARGLSRPAPKPDTIE